MNISMLGAGAWGTALAVALEPRHRVTLWARDAGQIAKDLSERQEYKFSWPFVRVKKQRNHRRARLHFHLTPWKLYNGMTSDDTLVAMLAVAASSRNPLFQKGKWRFVTACAARDDASRYFSEDPFRILGLRFCRCVKKEQNRRRGPLTLTELPDCCGRGNRAKNGAWRSRRRY